MPYESPPREERDAAAGEQKTWRPVAVAAGVVGVLLLVLYGWLEQLLPRGPQEFAYFPFILEPLPFAPMRGFTFEQLARHLGRVFVLGPSLAALGVALAAVLKSRRPRSTPARQTGSRTLLICAVGGSVLLSALVMARVLEGRAITDDELAYRQQAELLAGGRLAENTVPPWGWELFTISTRLGATGKYLFGEPLIQAPGVLLGLPALLHLLLVPLALWAWHRSVYLEAGAGVSAWATVLVAVSPMFILTNALALSHTATLTCLVLAGLGYQWTRAGNLGRWHPWAGALLTGSALGFGLTVRPQTVVPIGLVIGLATLHRLARDRRPGPAALLIVSGSFWLLLIGAYNAALSGSPFKLPWYLFQPIEKFGFGEVAGFSYVHTPWRAVENLVVVLVQFNGWWLGWPLSLALILGGLALAKPRGAARLWFSGGAARLWFAGRAARLWFSGSGAPLWLAGSAALIVLNAPYYSTGISDTGPVYYFELLLPAAILGGHVIARARSRWPTAVTALLIVHFGLGTVTFLGENVARLDRLVTAIHAPVEAIMEQLEAPALLIHESEGSQSMRVGWVWSFPARVRAESAGVVTYPSGAPKFLPQMLERYGYRHCWYYRRNPKTTEPELYRCAEAMELLLRPQPTGPPLRIPSTAERMGLFNP